MALQKKAKKTGKEVGTMKKNVYDGKTNVGGIGIIQGPYTPDKAPGGSVVTGGDLRSGSKGGNKRRK